MCKRTLTQIYTDTRPRHTEPRRYTRYSVSGYSSDTGVVYKYTWIQQNRSAGSRYSKFSRYNSDTADTAAIQQRYSSDAAEIQQEVQQRYSGYSTDTVTPPDAPPYHNLQSSARYSTDTTQI
eukprot:557809-Prymnesium_polylepis.1